MCKFVRLLVPWDSVTHDLMPVVGPHDDELAKVLQMGAESTFNDCIEVRAYLSNTICLYKTMLNESERLEFPEPVYYYHNDHLGGTAYLTDQTGQVAQTLAYLPYGEDWVDVTTFQYDTSQIGFYQFNGKEKDPETEADHMQNPSRSVPISIIDEVIKNPKFVTSDPQGSSAMMYYSTIFKNGKQYNIEVLYNRSNNTIFHFKYSNRELGPLPKIK